MLDRLILWATDPKDLSDLAVNKLIIALGVTLTITITCVAYVVILLTTSP